LTPLHRYGTLQSSWTKESKGTKKGGQVISEKSLAHKVEWHRIILDEAHNIKDRTTNVAKACFNLKGQYKWCLSGTPLQNRVGELYSLVRFLGGDPYSYYFPRLCIDADCLTIHLSAQSLHWKFSNKANCDECGHNPTAHVCLWNVRRPS
jgi:DNA repair protein RAD16